MGVDVGVFESVLQCPPLARFPLGHIGARGSVVVKALSYKPEDRGFDTLWGDFLNLQNPSGRTRPWGLLSL
jgi:hypothetical protein